MRKSPMAAVVVALALAACGTPRLAPSPNVAPGGAGLMPDGQRYPDGNTYRVMAIEELPIVGVTVDSQVASNPKERLIDGDLATQWVNGGYRNDTSWAAVELSGASRVASIGIKTGPSPTGTSYDVQVSSDGVTWTTALAGQTNSSWSLETKTLPGGATGKFVRIVWRNSAASPQPHFAIFELMVNGEPGAASPTPPPASPTPPPPSPTPPPSSPTPPPATSGPVLRLTPTGVTATSSREGLPPSRAIDRDGATQWTTGDYRAYEGALTLTYDRAYAFDHVDIKTGYLPQGVYFHLDVSDDGVTWTTAARDLTSRSWAMETHPVLGQGRYLRVRFYNTAGMAYLPIFEVAAHGRETVALTTRTVQVSGTAHRVHIANGVCINGSYQRLVHVDADAYNDQPAGIKFPAMLGVEHHRLGMSYARITPQNAADWSGDLGGCGSVGFIDTVDGLADNRGAWTFTHLDNTGETYFPITATVDDAMNAWDPARVASLDLGATRRTWKVDGRYLQPDGGDTSHSPGVVVVYKRPDGVWDFTVATGNVYPDGGPDLIETSGRVYAFFATYAESDTSADVRLTFTAPE